MTTKKALPPVLRADQLLSHGSSRKTVSSGELFISDIIRFADFDFFGENYRSDHFAALLVTLGQIEVAINLRRFTVRKWGLVVVSPAVIKQLVSASPNAKGIVVQFTMQFTNQAGLPKRSYDLINYFSSQYKPVWDLQKNDAVALEGYMRNLFLCCEHPDRPFSKEKLNVLFLAFLYEIASLGQRYSPPLIGKLTRKEDLVIRFASLVSTNFREQRSVQYYAQALHVTPKYLTETVKEISGKNAGSIIDDFVIVESKLLLEKPELTVAQVAEILNFSDQSFFGKYFKRNTGISPKEFKTTIHN